MRGVEYRLAPEIPHTELHLILLFLGQFGEERIGRARERQVRDVDPIGADIRGAFVLAVLEAVQQGGLAYSL